MSWRDRAVSVDAGSAPAAAGGWRSRAVPVVEEEDPKYSVPGFLDNAAKDAADQAKGVVALGGTALRTAADLATGRPLMETEGAKVAGDIVENLPKLPGAVVDRVKEVVGNPKKAFYEKPITTALDVASVVPAVGAGVRGVSELGEAVARTVPKIAESDAGIRALESVTGAPRKAIERRLARPDAVRNAIPEGAAETPFAPLADEVAKAANSVGEKARMGAAQAQDKLSTSRYLNDRAIPKDDILKIVDREKARLRVGGTVVGDAKAAALDRLSRLRDQLDGLRGETVSEARVKDVIKSLDPDINWKATENGPSNLALERLRFRLDARLKNANPDYREAIAPVSKQMRTLKRAQRQFGLEKETGSGLVASDATASKLKSIGSGKVPMSERRLAELAKESGGDFVERAKDIDAALKFEGGAPQGSRRVLSFGGTGAAAGAAAAGPAGAAIGGLAGAVLGLITDTSGRKIAAKIIDAYLAKKPTATALEMIEENPKLKAMIALEHITKKTGVPFGAYAGSKSVPAEDR